MSMDSLLNRVFRCWHRRLSMPITLAHSHTYVVCLDCGKRFAYDPEHMRFRTPVPQAAGSRIPERV